MGNRTHRALRNLKETCDHLYPHPVPVPPANRGGPKGFQRSMGTPVPQRASITPKLRSFRVRASVRKHEFRVKKAKRITHTCFAWIWWELSNAISAAWWKLGCGGAWLTTRRSMVHVKWWIEFQAWESKHLSRHACSELRYKIRFLTWNVERIIKKAQVHLQTSQANVRQRWANAARDTMKRHALPDAFLMMEPVILMMVFQALQRSLVPFARKKMSHTLVHTWLKEHLVVLYEEVLSRSGSRKSSTEGFPLGTAAAKRR